MYGLTYVDIDELIACTWPFKTSLMNSCIWSTRMELSTNIHTVLVDIGTLLLVVVVVVLIACSWIATTCRAFIGVDAFGLAAIVFEGCVYLDGLSLTNLNSTILSIFSSSKLFANPSLGSYLSVFIRMDTYSSRHSFIQWWHVHYHIKQYSCVTWALYFVSRLLRWRGSRVFICLKLFFVHNCFLLCNI